VVTAAGKISVDFFSVILKRAEALPVFSFSSNHTMKHDHSLTLTAAIVLAGVVLAFANPADASNSAAPVASAIESTPVLPLNSNAVAAVDSHPGASRRGEARAKGSCERIKHADPRA